MICVILFIGTMQPDSLRSLDTARVMVTGRLMYDAADSCICMHTIVFSQRIRTSVVSVIDNVSINPFKDE
jgi:hypothetical protein